MTEQTTMEKIEALLEKTKRNMETNFVSINKAYLAGKVAGIVAVIKIIGGSKQMGMITLTLVRPSNTLWKDLKGMGHIGVINDVTGVERDPLSVLGGVKILQKGHYIGMVWYVDEIKEKW